MTIVDTTSGFARSVQIIDTTGFYITVTDFSITDAILPNISYVVDQYGIQIPIETIGSKLASIREKSHSKLGEAWSKLAQM
jgi:hypothetical protein